MSAPGAFLAKRSVMEVLASTVAGSGRRPLSAMIEVADRCNHTCVHCYQVQGQKGEMSTDELRRVLDELAELGVLFLTLSGGEATLRSDLLEIIAHARRRRFAVKLFTNGYTMTAELAGELRRLAVQEVQISLYSHRAEVHDWVTGVPGSWARTVAGARHLLAAGMRVVLKTPLMRTNASERDAYVAFVTGLGADFAFDAGGLNPREDGERSHEVLDLDAGDLLEVLRNPSLGAGGGSAEPPPLDASVCGACSGNVHVEANGELRPCTLLQVDCGNVRDGGVKAAWHGERAEAVRALTWADLHGCRSCDLRSDCHRCYADAAMRGGDAFGPYASACARAKLAHEARTGQAFVLHGVRAGTGLRDGSLGPFRRSEPDGVWVLAPDEETERDRLLAAQHGWARPAADPCGPDRPTRPGGDLVQIRRPGARRAVTERLPPAGERG